MKGKYVFRSQCWGCKTARDRVWNYIIPNVRNIPHMFPYFICRINGLYAGLLYYILDLLYYMLILTTSPIFTIYVPMLYVGLMDYMQEYWIICRIYCIIFKLILLYLELFSYIHSFVLYLWYCIMFNLLYYI